MQHDCFCCSSLTLPRAEIFSPGSFFLVLMFLSLVFADVCTTVGVSVWVATSLSWCCGGVGGFGVYRPTVMGEIHLTSDVDAPLGSFISLAAIK